MALTPEELRRLAPLLQQRLHHARVRSVRQVLDHELTYVLECRTPGSNHWLELALDTPHQHLLLREERRPAPLTPSPFVMLLRKHVEGLSLLSLSVEDSVLRLSFGLEQLISSLLFEIEGPLANLYLCDASGTLLGSALPQRSAQRGLRVHHRYTPPEADAGAYKATAAKDWPEDDQLWDYLRQRFDGAVEEAEQRTLKRSLSRRLKQARKRAQRRVARVEQDLARAEDVAVLRHEADLLQSARHQIKRGASFVEIPDWNDPEMRTRRIELDPSQSVQAAIADRYRRYRRLKDAETVILERLESVEKQRDQLEAAWETFSTLEDTDALQKLAQQLEVSRLIQRENQQQQIRERARLPYKEARSSDGYRLLVGRTSKDNDQLSLRIARGRDIWLHARDSAGSHVIIWRDRGDEVPERTLFEAATLAAFHSTAKNDTRVDVSYTERKHISKPPGSPPGRVSVASMRTIYVEPDEALCRQLFENAHEARAQNQE